MSLINDALKRANQAQKQNAPARPKYTPLQPVDSTRRGFDWPSLLLPGVLVVALVGGGIFLWAWLKSPKPVAPPPAVATVPVPAKAAAPSQPVAPPPPAVVTPPIVKQPEPVKAPAPVTVVETPATAAPRQAKVPVTINTNIVVRAAPAAPPPVEAAAPPPAAVPTPVAATPTAPVPATIVPPPAPVAVAPIATAPPAVTAPVQTAKPAAPEFPVLKLQGILYRRTNPSAFINGKSCYVGDVVDKVTVTKIDRQSVSVEFNGQRKELLIEQ